VVSWTGLALSGAAEDKCMGGDRAYDNEDDDSGERTVGELEEVHSTLQEILSTLKSRDGWIWVVIFIILVEGWSGSKLDRWTDKVWYSFGYDADFMNIAVEKRPLDCDFLHAPLGGKGCQYKKRISIFGDEQRRAAIQQATTPEERQTYAKQPNSITVYWEKEEE
jgi:hypothetical protein